MLPCNVWMNFWWKSCYNYESNLSRKTPILKDFAMIRKVKFLPLCCLILVGLLTVGCKDDNPAVPGVTLDPLPNFSLLDVNPTSATAAQPVSPRDYLQQVSAWYFGHAT